MVKAILLISVILVIGVFSYTLVAPKLNPSSPSTLTSVTVLTPTSIPDSSADAGLTQDSIGYLDYSQSVFDSYSDKKRVYFFHATWCPTCKAANTAFMQNIGQIPEDVVVFKTDYDGETNLKQQFGITYQHTFVQVDSRGNEVSKWNGGDINALLSNLK